jgi:hypothetical protein
LNKSAIHNLKTPFILCKKFAIHAMAGAMLILAGVLIGLYGLAVLLGDREPDGTVREGVAGARKRRGSKR